MNSNLYRRIVIIAVILLLKTSLSTEVFSFQALNEAAHISGIVVDDNSGEQLLGANVYLSNTLMGTASDSSGVFRIRRIPLGVYKLIISYVGYETEIKMVEIDRAKEYEFSIRLKQITRELPEVTVSGRKPKDWAKNLKRFKREFIGTTKNAKKCKLLNPEVLGFQVNKNMDNFVASTGDMLIIENGVLGYRLKLNLLEFSINEGYVTYRTESYFEELVPDNDKEYRKWKESRSRAYRNSFKHFLISLIEKRTEEEGFYVSIIDALPPENTIAYKIDSEYLLVYNRNPHERTLKFRNILQVRYLPEAKQNRLNESTKENRSRLLESFLKLNLPTSWLVIAQEPVNFDINGIINNSDSIIQHGYWANHRIANFLPFEYRPDIKD